MGPKVDTNGSTKDYAVAEAGLRRGKSTSIYKSKYSPNGMAHKAGGDSAAFGASALVFSSTGLVPHHILAATSPLDDEDQVPTTKKTQRCPPLFKHGNRRPGSRERRGELEASKGRLPFRKRSSCHDTSLFPPCSCSSVVD